jgi:hypothetical protein
MESIKWPQSIKWPARVFQIPHRSCANAPWESIYSIVNAPQDSNTCPAGFKQMPHNSVAAFFRVNLCFAYIEPSSYSNFMFLRSPDRYEIDVNFKTMNIKKYEVFVGLFTFSWWPSCSSNEPNFFKTSQISQSNLNISFRSFFYILDVLLTYPVIPRT